MLGEGSSPVAVEQLGPGPRLLGAVATWLLLAAAQPGFLREDGFGHLGFMALVPWALASSRPGPRARLIEWAAAVLGLGLWFGWMRALLPALLVPMTIIPALYFVVGGRVLRGLAGRVPLALAVPLAWMVFEVLRWFLPFPLSFGWWRLGTLAADTEWLAGSARVWGVWGLSYLLAAFAGWVADLVLVWRRSGSLLGLGPLAHAAGLMPVALGAILTALVPAPPAEPGPGVLLVTPGLAQSIKAYGGDPLVERFLQPLDLTLEGLERAAAEGTTIDVVAWPETMVPSWLVGQDALDAYDEGVRRPDFVTEQWTRERLEWIRSRTQQMVAGVIFGQRELVVDPDLLARLKAWPGPSGKAWRAGQAILGPEVAFVSGIEAVVVEQDYFRRVNGVCVWTGGEPGVVASKQHLVPAAEDPYPAAYVPLLVDAINEVGGYVPDFVVREAPRTLRMPGPAGRESGVAVSVCYDQAFDDPFTTPVRAGGVDWHLVASNEAWYQQTLEMDHMLAFARLRAIQTGRAVARVTNSGITAVLGPDGDILAELREDGRRKQVRGALVAQVPVPVRDSAGAAAQTLYVRTEPLQIGFWWLLALGAWLTSRRRVTGGASGVSSQPSGAAPGPDEGAGQP